MRAYEHDARLATSTLSGCIVVREPNEPVDALLRRFRKEFEQAGIGEDLRRRESFEKWSVRRRVKSARARQREAKLQGAA